MKILKFVIFLLISVSLVFVITSCSKQKDAVTPATGVTKDQMVGKWTGNIQSNAGSPAFHADLKGSGAMELDFTPYDGITDIILLWDVNGNKFTAHVDANGVTNYWKIDATIDPKTMSMAGQLIVNDGQNPPITGIFAMDK